MPAEDGPRAVFERIYRANYDRVLAYALCRADRDRALDATGETFLVAWRRLGDLPDQPLPWLLGVARRVLADQRRASGRRDALVTRLAAQPAPPPGHDPADQVAASSHVNAALARLRPDDREVLTLLAWDGLTPEQAAESLGCSRATFAVRLHRARRRMERELTATSAPRPRPTRTADSFRRVS
jgi:RNA polymerase sigma-70 factor (ECF subfamily)